MKQLQRSLGFFLFFLLLSVAFAPALAQQVLFEDGFESGQLDPAFWTPRPSLEGASGGLVDVFNATGDARTGSFSARLGRAADGAETTNALDLRLDLSGQTQVELRFWIRSFFDETQAQEGLYFSDDGGQSFTEVVAFDLLEDETDDVYYSLPPIDVDALAAAHGLALTSTFVIRFQQIGTGDFNTIGDEDGFIIDDVSVTVPEIVYAKLPFSDGFEDGDFGPMWQVADPSDPLVGEPTAPSFAPLRWGGLVDVLNSPDEARTGTFSARLGRANDGPSTTSALDLRLDLSGHSQVQLLLRLRDFYDETQAQEGLYFSDDGGQTFTQVMTFELDDETENIYLTSPPIDVDALAAAHGLALTSTFVIRFQQIGTGDFSTIGDEDGFFLDDVSVFVPAIAYATLPFTDGFESGTGGPMWHAPDPSDPILGEPTAPSFAPHRWGGFVSIVSSSSDAHSGTFSVFMGRVTDGAATTNALDLLLDLSAQSQVELRFWLRDFFDDTQIQEGLYFSDDGGKTFAQAFALDPSSLPDNQYSELVVDVDALAAAQGLSLTSTFVIRFQQIGTGNFSTVGDEDGFIIDDVSVLGDVNVAVEGEEEEVPEAFTLEQNYPNPFNPSTTIRYALARPGPVRLEVFDVLGRRVQTLVDARQRAGRHTVRVDLQGYPSGVYVYRLQTPGFTRTRRMILLE